MKRPFAVEVSGNWKQAVMNSLLGQIRKSRLVEWLIAYVAFAWLAAQIVSVIADVWGLSSDFQRRAHIVLAFGIPATAILAWFHGERGEQRFSRGELFVLAALFCVTAIAIPSVGADGPTAVFGIPSSIVLPCSVLMMIVIPAWLIILSVYKDQQSEGFDDPKPTNRSLEETLNELWRKLVTASNRRQVMEVHEQALRLMVKVPESTELRALQISADKMAQHIPANRGLPPGVADDLYVGSEDSSVSDNREPGTEFEDTGKVIARARKSDGGLAGSGALALGVDEAASAHESRSPANRASSVVRQIGKELNRRNVTRAVVIYSIVVFGGFTLGDVAFQALGSFGTLRSLAVVLVAFGLSILIILSWFHGKSQ